MKIDVEKPGNQGTAGFTMLDPSQRALSRIFHSYNVIVFLNY